jgi:hypothetical protein
VTSDESAVQAWAVSAQIDARWLLPLPRGPLNSRIVSGQSGQLSIRA